MARMQRKITQVVVWHYLNDGLMLQAAEERKGAIDLASQLRARSGSLAPPKAWAPAASTPTVLGTTPHAAAWEQAARLGLLFPRVRLG